MFAGMLVTCSLGHCPKDTLPKQINDAETVTVKVKVFADDASF